MRRLMLIITMLGLVLGMSSIALAQTGQYTTGDEGQEEVTICHIPPGNPADAHYITVAESAVAAHVNHGDLVPGDSGYDTCGATTGGTTSDPDEGTTPGGGTTVITPPDETTPGDPDEDTDSTGGTTNADTEGSDPVPETTGVEETTGPTPPEETTPGYPDDPPAVDTLPDLTLRHDCTLPGGKDIVYVANNEESGPPVEAVVRDAVRDQVVAVRPGFMEATVFVQVSQGSQPKVQLLVDGQLVDEIFVRYDPCETTPPDNSTPPVKPGKPVENVPPTIRPPEIGVPITFVEITPELVRIKTPGQFFQFTPVDINEDTLISTAEINAQAAALVTLVETNNNTARAVASAQTFLPVEAQAVAVAEAVQNETPRVSVLPDTGGPSILLGLLTLGTIAIFSGLYFLRKI